MDKKRGFSLIELMVTLAVAAILLAVAVPNMRSFIQNNKAAATSNQLLSALNFARSKAVHFGRGMTLCSSTDATTCSASTNWATGWVMLDSSNNVVQIWPALTGTSTLTSTQTSVTYNGLGGVSAATTFTLVIPGCTGNLGRTVKLTATGRSEVTKNSC